ncbi:MAG: 2,3-bisphosphoglycerate-dependent phosphoglycerate mutase [Acidimicrobiia bacterium]|nr:2,3-bisphosphoglycerate-dependent phosphoglycerate mutase [Acidimicrobiia bacterium]
MSDLVLIRHGQSVWNLENLFTGWVDVGLSEQGEDEAKKAGAMLRGRRFDVVFTSMLKRAVDTADMILAEMGHPPVETIRAWEINERYYGRLTGMNKDGARREFGEDQVHVWRRSYDVCPPGGESLADTAARSIPYFQERILPRVQAGEDVLVSAHGNSLRSIVMEIDGLSRDEVVRLELATGDPRIYTWDDAAGRLVRAAEPE